MSSSTSPTIWRPRYLPPRPAEVAAVGAAAGDLAAACFLPSLLSLLPLVCLVLGFLLLLLLLQDYLSVPQVFYGWGCSWCAAAVLVGSAGAANTSIPSPKSADPPLLCNLLRQRQAIRRETHP